MHQMASWTIGKGKTFLSKQYCVYITKINILKVFFKISNQNFYKFRKFCKCQYTRYFHTFTIFLINCFHSSTNVLWYRLAHKKLKIVFVHLLVFSFMKLPTTDWFPLMTATTNTWLECVQLSSFFTGAQAFWNSWNPITSNCVLKSFSHIIGIPESLVKFSIITFATFDQ